MSKTVIQRLKSGCASVIRMMLLSLKNNSLVKFWGKSQRVPRGYHRFTFRLNLLAYYLVIVKIKYFFSFINFFLDILILGSTLCPVMLPSKAVFRLLILKSACRRLAWCQFHTLDAVFFLVGVLGNMSLISFFLILNPNVKLIALIHILNFDFKLILSN